MSNQQNDEFDLVQYRKDICRSLTEEIFNIVQGESRKHGNEFGHNILIGLIRNVIATMVMNSLMNAAVPEGMSKEEATIASYRTVKGDVMGAIADAFAHAMQRHTGSEIDYMCEIQPVGEPINKKEV